MLASISVAFPVASSVATSKSALLVAPGPRRNVHIGPSLVIDMENEDWVSIHADSVGNNTVIKIETKGTPFRLWHGYNFPEDWHRQYLLIDVPET